MIRSPDGTIGAPDPVTGAPTGNDSVADTTTYSYPADTFQGNDWYETEGYYVCVRIWNASTTLAGTYYRDSVVYQATGMLPMDIDCSGARTDKPKDQATPTETPTKTPTLTPTETPTIEVSPTATPTATPPTPTPSRTPTLMPTETPTETPLPTATDTPEPTVTPTPEMSPTSTPTAAPPAPTLTPTVSPTVMPTGTPTTVPTPTATSVIDLASNKTVVETGDSLVMNLAISEPISNKGKIVMYVLVRTPQGGWFSFVSDSRRSFNMKQGIRPAMSGTTIPSLDMPVLNQKIAGSLARGDYWFVSAVFHAGDRISLADWRSKAIYSSEATITVR